MTNGKILAQIAYATLEKVKVSKQEKYTKKNENIYVFSFMFCVNHAETNKYMQFDIIILIYIIIISLVTIRGNCHT